MIESAVNAGTVVTLLLPRATDAAVAAPAGDPEQSRPAAGASALDIVLVEDDDRVRATTEEALVELGHRVRSVNGGAAALLEIASRVPDLMVTDIVMPDMNGRRLADIVRRDQPGLPILFVSAFEPDGPDRGSGTLLRKPYSLDALATAIAQAMT